MISPLNILSLTNYFNTQSPIIMIYHTYHVAWRDHRKKKFNFLINWWDFWPNQKTSCPIKSVSEIQRYLFALLLHVSLHPQIQHTQFQTTVLKNFVSLPTCNARNRSIQIQKETSSNSLLMSLFRTYLPLNHEHEP